MSTNRLVAKETEQLYAAALAGDTARVQELLSEKTADVNFHQRNHYGSTPMIAAIIGGHVETVRALLDGGADVAALRTPDANSPLHEACFQRNPAIVRLLIEHKDQFQDDLHDANDKNAPRWSMVDAVNQFGNVPLHAAAMAGSVECVEALLEAGALVDASNNQHSTPLHHACYCGSPNEKVVELLVRAKADVNLPDKNHATPLIVAAKKNQVGAISVLLEAGADPGAVDDSGRNAHASAVLRGNLECAALLKDLAPIDPDVRPLDPDAVRRPSLTASMYAEHMYHHQE
ncbi:hypothetical protein SDRG_01767 [Saprolegnia diclina VS20]|uniref:Uncharacterized protein n=1 Tax=Saprolegnia diclina (strain VS20) TaxID=1156394 RepID=T0R157_SAPDV|nr:hypothetical protein SDRG_01767 [Saprolegnia diclina VS20]EQC40691.1 hypothetical protein SDRG_01767 [Saprolegnia diclina VS20]|eukprot:XP_008605535.1 hypothetical protein SDRG_01767 [Saprolegnia diclina VS20]